MNFYNKINKWPVKIRLYPEIHSSLYALTYVWPTQKTMIKEVNSFPYVAKSEEYYKVDKDVLATTFPLKYTDKKTKRVLPLFAHVHLCVPFINEYFISHELTHATIGWVHRINLVPDFMYKKNELSLDTHYREERFVTAQSTMVLQLTSRLAKLGLYNGN